MKSFRLLIAIVVLCLGGTANADSIPYNTGVNSSGIPLASGAIDPHYTLVSSPMGTVRHS